MSGRSHSHATSIRPPRTGHSRFGLEPKPPPRGYEGGSWCHALGFLRHRLKVTGITSCCPSGSVEDLLEVASSGAPSSGIGAGAIHLLELRVRPLDRV